MILKKEMFYLMKTMMAFYPMKIAMIKILWFMKVPKKSVMDWIIIAMDKLMKVF